MAKKLLEIMRDKIRFKHYSLRTVELPYQLDKKYPKAKLETKWQYIFPMNKVSKDPRSDVIRRHHILEVTFSINIKQAVHNSNAVF